MSKILEELKRIIKESGLDNQEISDRTGIKKTNISMYRNNPNNMRIDTFVKLCAAVEYELIMRPTKESASYAAERDLLIKFFMFFRDNGEANIGITIEEFVDLFLSSHQDKQPNHNQ